MTNFGVNSLDSHSFFVNSTLDDDNKRLQEWLNLDQAGDDIGIPNHSIQPFIQSQDSNDYLFESDKFDTQFATNAFMHDSQSDPNKLLSTHPSTQAHLDHSILSLDPSVIMDCAPHPTHDPQNISMALNNPFHPVSNNLPCPQPTIAPSSLSPQLDQSSSMIKLPSEPSQEDILVSCLPPNADRPYPLDPLLASATFSPSAQTNLQPPFTNKPLPLSQLRQPNQKSHPPNDENENEYMKSPSRSVSCPTETCEETSGSNHKRTPSHPHALIMVPEWEDRPSAEEYKMLSSKEKRQLRNKISARNFRHRRKEHISTLEQQLINRDKTIDSLRQDLGQVKTENVELKAEIDLLKTKWSDLMKKIEEMSLGATSSASSLTSSPSTHVQPSSTSMPLSPRLRSTTKPSMMLQMPNLHKDVGTHSRKPFNGVGGMTGGGNVGVHTTLIPDVPINVYCNPSALKSRISTDSTIDQTLSPQALIEQKHLSKSDTNVHSSTHLLSHVNNLEALITAYSAPLIKANDLETVERTIDNLGRRLSQILVDAFKSSNESEIDEEKLLGCLDGRYVLEVVERAPPAYDAPSLDQLTLQLSRINLETHST